MTDEQRTLNDEDIRTHPTAAPGSAPRVQGDADGTDTDGSDGDAADGSDGDATDLTDGDAGDADGTDGDATDADGRDA